MKAVFFVFSYFLFSSISFAQNWIWAEKIGLNGAGNDYGYDILLDDSLNVYVTGRVKNATNFGSGSSVVSPPVYGDRDIFLAKYDNSGSLIWAKRYGGTGSDYGYGLAKSKNGEILLAGYFEGTAVFDDTTLVSQGIYDLFVMSVNCGGNRNWILSGGISGGSTNANKLTTDSLGNIYITGWYTIGLNVASSSITSYGNMDAFLMKLDMNGNLIFLNRAGGTLLDEGIAIAASNDGFIYLAGRYSGNLFSGVTATSKGGQDAFLAKYDLQGNLVWVRNGGSSTIDIARSISFFQNGNICLGGVVGANMHFGSFNANTNGVRDIFFTRLDENGNFINLRSFGSAADDELYDTKIDDKDNIYYIGVTDDTIAFDNDSVFLSGAEDIIFGKLDQDFNSAWVKSLTGYTASGIFAHGFAIELDSLENIYPTGGFLYTVNFDTISMVSSGASSDVFLGKISSELYGAQILPGEGCIGDSIPIDLTMSSSANFIHSFLIEDNDTTTFLTPPSSINPFVGVNIYQSWLTDGTDTLILNTPIYINPIPDPIANNEIYKCEADEIILTIPIYDSIFWNNGLSTNSISVGISGTYTVYVEDTNYCAYTDTIQVYNYAPLLYDLGEDTSICFNDSLLIESVLGSGLTYVWNNGSNGYSIIATETGMNSLTITDSNLCAYKDSIFVNVRLPLVLSLGSDTITCDSSGLYLTPDNLNYSSFLWSTGSNNDSLFTNLEGEYWLNVIDSFGCIAYDTIMVDFQTCNDLLEMIDSDFDLFPNPVISAQPLQLSGLNDNCEFRMLTADGRVVRQGNLMIGTNLLQAPDNSGLYFLELTTDKGKIIKRILVQ